MNRNEAVARDLRRKEAALLIGRLQSDLVIAQREIEEIRTGSIDKDRMARDPSYVHDNLGGVISPLMYFDLRRLWALFDQGL